MWNYLFKMNFEGLEVYWGASLNRSSPITFVLYSAPGATFTTLPSILVGSPRNERYSPLLARFYEKVLKTNGGLHCTSDDW